MFWKLLIFVLLIIVDLSQSGYVDIYSEPDSNDYPSPDAYRSRNEHPCRGSCHHMGPALNCHYTFQVESYKSMSKACYNCPFNLTDCCRQDCIPTDGSSRNIITINRQFPGPSIEVCKGDTITVDVVNDLLSDSISVHWHGIKQRETPHMDGVPFVTQCPILAGRTFRYEFEADESGTYFYHSHTGTQLSDGLFGAIIIREKEEYDVHRDLYDFDHHTVIINDWQNVDGLTSLMQNIHDSNTALPTTLLINGKGQNEIIVGSDHKIGFTPLEIFNVLPGYRYRFRLINAGNEDCPMDFSIDGHSLLVIALDGNDIRPVEVDAITAWSGERIDFILTANQHPKNYWIRVNGYGLCINNNGAAYQTAVLKYGDINGVPDGPVGHLTLSNQAMVLNAYQTGTEVKSRTNVQISDLYAIKEYDRCLQQDVDQQIFITFDSYRMDNKVFHRRLLYGYYQVQNNSRFPTPQLNHISMKFPKYPLLTERYMIPPETICNNETLYESNINCEVNHCTCTHVKKIKLNTVVELVLIDQGLGPVINHPLHLHGHFFHVVASENLNGSVTIDRFKQLDEAGLVKRRLSGGFPPLKDTMKIPNGGYTVVRFIANNPGYWMFHCHFEPHLNLGMSMVFQVGEDYEMPPAPVDFPKC